MAATRVEDGVAETLGLLLGASFTVSNEATTSTSPAPDGTATADVPLKDMRCFERSRNATRSGVVVAALLVLMGCAATLRGILLGTDNASLGQTASFGGSGRRDNGQEGPGVLRTSKIADTPRVLIAIITHRGDARRFSLLEGTWMQNLHSSQASPNNGVHLDYYAFVGRPGESGAESSAEEVNLLIPSVERKVVGLDVGDAYEDLPAKVFAAFKWAREHDYDYVFKADSDVYINPLQFARSVSAWHSAGYDWVGQVGLIHEVPPGGTFEVVFDPAWHFDKCKDPQLNRQPYEGVLPLPVDGSRGYLLSRNALAALGRFENRRGSWLEKYTYRNLYEDLLVSFALHEEGIELRDYTGWSLVGKGYDVKHVKQFLRDTRSQGELSQLVKMRQGGGVPAVVPAAPGTAEAGVLKCTLIPGVCPKLDLKEMGADVFHEDPAEVPPIVQLHMALQAVAPGRHEALRGQIMATVMQRRAEREQFLARAEDRGLGTKRDPAIPHLGKFIESRLGEEKADSGVAMHIRHGTEGMGYV